MERYIHSEIYKARPDVQCVLHTHSPAVLPYCFVDTPLRPVTHMGAFIGESVPVYEIRDKHGDETDLFGGSPDVCADIAESLGGSTVVLMARHGVVNVGNSVREVVFRAFYLEAGSKGAHSRPADRQDQVSVAGRDQDGGKARRRPDRPRVEPLVAAPERGWPALVPVVLWNG
ncbi:class II aldolase/adducin family protein [Mesorhizobium atlanticum]